MTPSIESTSFRAGSVESEKGSFTDPESGATVGSRFIGEPGSRLFVCTYLPPGKALGGVVICPSLHAELLSNYRAEVRLAQRLAASGVAVLRLHYKGTGQSEGDEERVTFDSMRDDIASCAAAFQESAELEVLGYVGARFGALLGASAASESSPIVLWEPVFDGRRYWREVSRSRTIHKMRESVGGGPGDADMLSALESSQTSEALGYKIQPDLFRSTVSRKLGDEMSKTKGPVLLVQLSRQSELRAPHRAFVDEMRARGLDMDVELIPDEPVWWLLRPPMQGMDRLIDVTSRWLTDHMNGRKS